jgi:hypothetical protein
LRYTLDPGASSGGWFSPPTLRILEGEFREGDVVTVDAEEDRIVFHRAANAEIV